MSKAEARPGNFTRQIIDEGLASGEHTTVHTHFPLGPNGYLHTGHVKPIRLNFGIMQDYQGQCNLHFDNTNPVKGGIECVESIKGDVEWLGFRWTGDIRCSLDYFDQFCAYAVKLINKEPTYVGGLSADGIREYCGMLAQPGKDSPYYDRSVGENLALFEKMRAGGFEEDKACLYVKIGIALPFIVMCDPMLYRIKFAEHHQTGNSWCIYPMYDFTHHISDVLEGTTRSLCTFEFQGNHRLYGQVLGNTTIPVHPRRYELSYLNLEYTMMSRRKLNLLVTDKHVEGWDDPCMPMISSLHHRGYTAATIREFCKHIDVTKRDNTIEITSLESCIREDLSEDVPHAVMVINPVKLVIENYPQGESGSVTMPSRSNKPEMGSREVPFSGEIWTDRTDFREETDKRYRRLAVGKEVRLRNAYVIKVERAEKDAEENITTIFRAYDADTLSKDPVDGHKVKDAIHWVSVSHALPIEIRSYDRLFGVSNPGAAKGFLSVISPESLVTKQGHGELSLQAAAASKTSQFECKGYFCLDSRYTTAEKLVFNRTAGLRDTWAKVGG